MCVCVCVPPSSADLLPFLFPFSAVPKAFWQGSDFCAHSSVLKEKRAKTKGLEAWGGWWQGRSPAACRSPRLGQKSVGMGPGEGFWCLVCPESPWHHFGHLYSDTLLQHCVTWLAIPCWRGGLEKQGLFFLLLQNVG